MASLAHNAHRRMPLQITRRPHKKELNYREKVCRPLTRLGLLPRLYDFLYYSTMWMLFGEIY